MPVNVKISTDTSGLSQGLNKAKQQLNSTKNTVNQSTEALDSFGDNADNAVRALDSMTGAAGGASTGFSGLAGDLIALAKNPIAAVIAAVGMLVLAFKDLYERTTVTGKEWFNSLNFMAKRSEESLKATRDEVKATDSYIDSLDRLMTKEKLTNVQRIQAIELLSKMKDVYADLSFQIDSGTGRILGNWEKAKQQIYAQRQKLLKESQRKSIDAATAAIAAKMAMEVEGSNPIWDLDLIQLLTATKNEWNWETKNSKRLRRDGLDAELLNTITGRNYDDQNINGKQGWNSYTNGFSFINEWNKTLEIEDELQKRIAQRQVLLRRVSEKDIIATEETHAAVTQIINDYDKLIQKLKEIENFNSKQLNSEQLQYIDKLAQQTAQIKEKTAQNNLKRDENFRYIDGYGTYSTLTKNGFNVGSPEKLIEQSDYQNAKKKVYELRKELVKLQEQMKKYSDFDDLSAYDKVQAAELQKKTADIQSLLSQQELYVSGVQRARKKQESVNAEAFKNSRAKAKQTIQLLKQQQAAINGLSDAEEKRIRLEKIQAEAAAKKLKYTQEQIEAIDKQRQKLKQLNEEKTRLDKFNSVMDSLSQQKNLLNLEQGSDQWYLERAKQNYSDLNLNQQTTIAQSQKQLDEQTRRISALKTLEDKHADILTRFGEMFDQSKTGQLQRAIKSFEKNAGYQLTGDDRRKFESLFDAQWAMNQEQPILQLVSGIKSNSLTQRGGWAAGATNILTIQSINKRIASYNLKQINILNQIKRAIDNSGRI